MAGTFPISGQIDPKSFPFLVADLHRNGATGSLKVEGPTYQKALYYRTGRILFGSSNDPRDQLGAILIEEGRITPEQLEDVNSKVGPGNPLAKVLSETGFVNQRELSDAARAKVERILCDLIGYTQGNFEFEDGVLPKGAVDLKLSTERLMLTAVRRITDRTFVLRHLEGLDVILRATSDLAALRPELEPETGGLLAHLDGVATLKEAASRTRLDDFEAAKVACGLLFVGVVERAGAGGSLLDLGDTAREALNPNTWAQPIETEPEPAPRASVGDDSIIAWANSDPTAFAQAAEMARKAAAAAEAAKAPKKAPAPVPDPNPALFIPEDEPLVLDPPKAPAPPPRPAAAIPSEPVVPPIRKAVTPAARPAPPPPPSPPPIPDPPTIALSELPPAPPPPAPPAPEPARVVAPARTWTPPPKAKEREQPVLSDAPRPGSVTQSRPSKEDLAALDALLGPRTPEGPLEPLERAPEPRWQPPARSVQAKRTEGGGSRIVLIGLGLLALAGAGAAGWYYLMGPGAGPKTAGRPSPSPVATARPSAGPTALPASTAPSLAPTAPPSHAPTAAPTVAPTPVPTPVPVTGGDPLARARAQLRQGDLAGAARGFESHLRAGAAASTFSIQLFVACAPDTVQKAVGEVNAPELFILPVSYKGKDCFRLCWGVYGNAAGAAAASRALPDYFVRGGAAPRVMSAAELLK